jgi:hypothetical protein
MSFDYTARKKIALGMIIFFALFSNYHLLMDWVTSDLSLLRSDNITQYQKRFDRIRPMLPERGEVGFLGLNLNHDRYWESDAGTLRDWFLTQYTLAPLIVAITPNHRLVIINRGFDGISPDSPDNATVQDLGNGNKVRDFGNGLKLLTSER